MLTIHLFYSDSTTTGSSACQQNEDFYAVITMEGIHFLHVTKPETHRILWSGEHVECS